MTHIYVDADACPVKEEIYKVARRHRLEVTLVANAWMQTPLDTRIRLEKVAAGADVADDWIAQRAAAGDVVVTADILLAGRCLESDATVIGPTGNAFTQENIGDAIATRALLADLRSAGEGTGGPSPITARDRSRFLQELDNAIVALKREPGP